MKDAAVFVVLGFIALCLFLFGMGARYMRDEFESDPYECVVSCEGKHSLRYEARRLKAKLDRIQDRLTAIEQANVDRWQEGYATAERQIAAWLRFKANDPWPYDSLDHAVEVTLKRAAESIENQEHRRKDDRED